VRSTNDQFRDEIEAILDAMLPRSVNRDRLVVKPASEITEGLDWWPLAERLAEAVGEPLLAEGVNRPSRLAAATARTRGTARVASNDQLALDLGR
jgi:hypothetical protein